MFLTSFRLNLANPSTFHENRRLIKSQFAGRSTMDVKNSNVPSPRIPLEMNIEYRKSYGRANAKGILKNISLTGAFLETETIELVPEDKVVLEFTVSERR